MIICISRIDLFVSPLSRSNVANKRTRDIHTQAINYMPPQKSKEERGIGHLLYTTFDTLAVAAKS